MKKFYCEPCDYTTDDKSNFAKHKSSKKHNGIKIDDDVQPNINEIIKIKNKYKCNHCYNLFDSINDIEVHVKLDCKYDLRYNKFYIFDENKTGKIIFNESINAGDIYIIQTDFSLDDVFKIGITTNLENRLTHYRTGCNYEPRVHYYFPCKDILQADKILKIKLKQFNIKREIYKGDIEQIKNTILKNLRDLNDKKKLCYRPDVKICDICECHVCRLVFFTNIDLVNHKCCYCNGIYSSPSSLARHKKSCNEKEILINKFQTQITNQKIELNSMIDTLKKENAELKQLYDNDNAKQKEIIKSLMNDYLILQKKMNNIAL